MNTKLMKIVVAFVAVISTFMSAIWLATAEDIYLYRYSNFQGQFQQLRADAARRERIDPELSKRVSSLSVPSGATVTLRDGESGRSATFMESAAYVGDEVNDRADWIEITPACPPEGGVC